jgi:DNA-binding transcriptional regulator YiaG
VKKIYQDEIARSIHEMAEGLYKIGAIDDAAMHEYDDDCLIAEAMPRQETRAVSEAAAKFVLG